MNTNYRIIFLLPCLLCSQLAAMDTATASNAGPKLLRLQTLQKKLQSGDLIRAETFAKEPDGRILRNTLRYMARNASTMLEIVQKDPTSPLGNALSQICAFLTNCAKQLEMIPTTREQDLAHYIRKQLEPFEKETKK